MHATRLLSRLCASTSGKLATGLAQKNGSNANVFVRLYNRDAHTAWWAGISAGNAGRAIAGGATVGALCIYGLTTSTEVIASDSNEAAVGPAMVHFKQVKDMELPEVANAKGSKARMKTIVHSNVPGKQMQAGLFQLDPGPGYPYTYCYESIVLVISGQFTVKHAGGTYTLKSGDNIHVPAGCKLEYSSGEQNSRLYFVIQPPQAEDSARIQAGIDANPAPTIKANIPALKIIDDIPLLDKTITAKAYLGDFLVSDVKGKEMASGLYKVFQGPRHDYVYDYEEFKYIVEGQLNLRDGTGQWVEAKAGDLMYFPNGAPINFGTTEKKGGYGLGFFVGQRVGGSA